MKIQGIIFDVYGTLIDIYTDEGRDDIYRSISRFLAYQGIDLNEQDVREKYYAIMDAQRKTGGEEHPEFDAVRVWRELIGQCMGKIGSVPSKQLKYLPRFLAELYRSLSLHRLELYPDVKGVLDEFRLRFKMAAVSDAQSVWVLPEMRTTGIISYFNPIIVSSSYGFRKPDRRLFEAALTVLKLTPNNVIFVGNDMYRDIFGAGKQGMKTVFFSSNQGRKESAGIEPDYIIYQFGELRNAVAFFEGS